MVRTSGGFSAAVSDCVSITIPVNPASKEAIRMIVLHGR